jgi:hypothetical protein
MPIGETPVDGGCNLHAAQPKASGGARWTRVRGRSPRASGPSATVSATGMGERDGAARPRQGCTAQCRFLCG